MCWKSTWGVNLRSSQVFSLAICCDFLDSSVYMVAFECSSPKCLTPKNGKRKTGRSKKTGDKNKSQLLKNPLEIASAGGGRVCNNGNKG